MQHGRVSIIKHACMIVRSLLNLEAANVSESSKVRINQKLCIINTKNSIQSDKRVYRLSRLYAYMVFDEFAIYV